MGFGDRQAVNFDTGTGIEFADIAIHGNRSAPCNLRFSGPLEDYAGLFWRRPMLASIGAGGWAKSSRTRESALRWFAFQRLANRKQEDGTLISRVG